MKRISKSTRIFNKHKDSIPALSRICAVAACKGSRAVLHRVGSGGTSFPGRAAMLLKKDLLAAVSEGMNCIVVTGTNGKTTTSAMLARMMQLAGLDPVSNRSGANLLSGVTAELTACADWRGHPKKKYAVIECDEGALHQVLPFLRPKVIVVTNVFRDQLDRYGEVMHTLESIRRGIRLAPDALLCLNADDSLTASLALDLPNPVAWFGMEPVAEEKTAAAEEPVAEEKTAVTEKPAAEEKTDAAEKADTQGEIFAGKGQASEEELSASEELHGSEKTQISDARFCIRCGAEYLYTFRTYAHLGGFCCPACGYRRKKPGTAVMLPPPVSGSSELDCAGMNAPSKKALGMRFPGGGTAAEEVKIAAPALYNLYNAAAASCAALESGFGISKSAVIRALEETEGSFGRMERLVVGQVPVQMILVKNPAGCNQVLDYLCGIREPYTAVLCLNDEDADGHDISWIWDVDYEKLACDPFLHKIYVWGERAEDLQLRLKYAGIAETGIELIKEKKALLEAIGKSREPVYILPNYTTMLSLWKALKKQAIPS